MLKRRTASIWLLVLAGLAVRCTSGAPPVTYSSLPHTFESVRLPEATATPEPPTPTITPAATLPDTSLSPMTTTLVATGDVLLGRMVRTESEARQSYTWPFEATRDLLAAADITLINLESPITNPCPASTIGLIFCAPPASVEALTYAGIDVANIANNHILDKEIEGYAATLGALQAAGIQPSDEYTLAVIERAGTRFGFLGFNRIAQYPDTPILPEEDLLSRIADADGQVDVLVVSIHWGEEFRTWVHDNQRQLAYEMIDAGADLIVGTHPHVVQPYEEFNGALILYSLGNFVFDDMSNLTVRRGQAARITFEGARMVGYELIDVTIHDYGQPRIDE